MFRMLGELVTVGYWAMINGEMNKQVVFMSLYDSNYPFTLASNRIKMLIFSLKKKLINWKYFVSFN